MAKEADKDKAKPAKKSPAKEPAEKKAAKPKKEAAAKEPAAKKPAKEAAPKKPKPEKVAAEAAPAKPARAAPPPKPKKPAVAKVAKPIPEKAVKVTQIGSPIGRKDYQRATLRGLGLDKLHRSRILEDTPAVRGMIE